MMVATAEVRVHLPLAASLKDRRHVLDSALARLRAKFPVAASQVALDDDARWATLGLAVVAGAGRHAEAVREDALRYLESLLEGHAAHVVEISREML